MIIALNSNDNNERSQAEAVYNQTKKDQPGWLFQALIEVGCNSNNIQGAQLALVLLRKNFSDLFGVVEQFTNDQLAHIKQSLLSRFGAPDTPHPVRKATASAIANLATKLSTGDRNAWPNLWELLVSTAGGDNQPTQLRAMCLEVFSQVATMLVTTYFAPQLPRFGQALAACLANNDSQLRTKAIECFGEFVHVAEDNQMPVLRQLGTNVVNAYRATVNAGNDEDATEQAKFIRGIIEESDVTAFQDCYGPLLDVCYECASNQKLEADTRHMALGCLLSVGGKTRVLKGNRAFVNKLFNLLFEYMLHPEFDGDWEQTYEKEEDEEKKTDFDAGAQGADRLSHIVRGKTMEELAAPCIMQNVNSENWKNRGAALTLLCYVFEGAMKSFMTHLDTIVQQVVIPRLNDPHPFVRYSAMQCVAQFSADLCPGFQQQYAGKFLPIVCDKLINDCPRIMTLAAATLTTVFDELDNAKDPDEEEDNKNGPDDKRYKSTRFMNDYFGPVCQSLFACLKSDKPVFVHSESLAALSALIQLAEARVRPVTSDIVNCCQHYLNYPGNTPDAALIRCRAIECTTLTASYVKKESFSPYARDVCNYLLGCLKSGMAQDDMRLRYVLRGWTCMVECLGSDVLEFLGEVMNPLMNIAHSKCDAERIEKDIGEEFKDTDDIKHVRICTPGKGEHVLRMHNGLIEDKDLAATILLNFTEELKGHMYPYMHDLTALGIELLEFQALSETRETGAELLRSILRVVQDREPANVDNYIRHVVPKIFEAIDDEAEAESVQVMLGAVAGILTKASPGCLPSDLNEDAARMMFEIYQLSIENITELQLRRTQENDDDEIEDLENDENEEADLLQDCATVIGQLLRIVPGFVDLFEQRFLPMTTALLDPQLQDTQHQIAVHLLCEFVEHSGPAVAKHLPNAFDTFFRFSDHENSDVVQAGIYGLACSIEALSNLPRDDQAKKYVEKCYDLCGRYLSNENNARDEEWLGVTTNVCSLALRLIKHFSSAINSKTIFELVMKYIPTEDDEIETTRIHDLFVQWMQDSNHPLLGNGSPYRQHVMTVLKETNLLSEESKSALQKMNN